MAWRRCASRSRAGVRRRPTPTAARTRSRRPGARTDRVRPMLIEGARALVCGGASGLGAATARRLHAAGALVTIADVNEDGGRALVQELERRAAFVRCDVTDPAAVDEAVIAARGDG